MARTKTTEELFGGGGGGKTMTTEELFAGGGGTKAEPKAMSTRELFGGDIDQVVRAQTPKFESFLRGAAQGGSFGLADEATGAGEALGSAVFGKDKILDLLDNYRKYRDESRVNYGQAKEDNPYSYGGGELTGGLATAVIPGFGVAKNASLLNKLLTATGTGAAVGLGTSTADLTKGELGDLVSDTTVGGVTGAATQGVLSGLGAAANALVPKNAAKKLANVFLNTPEQITEKYMQNPKAIKNAELIHKVGTEFNDEALEKLKRLVTEGSAESRELLAGEGSTIPKAEVAAIYNKAANQIAKQSEWVISDPQKLAAYNSFKEAASNFSNDIDPVTKKAIPEFLSTNRLKDELQSLDRLTYYNITKGAFDKVDNTLKKGVKRTLNEELGKISPAYKEMMPEVAADAKLLEEATALSKSPAGFTNLFKRLATDEYGTGQIPRKTLEKVDARLGTTYVTRAENAMVKQAFDKSITNGSMNVNKFAAMLRDVPGVKYIAPLVGATVDKYGRALTMLAVDTSIYLQNLARDSRNIQEFTRIMTALSDAAKKGNTVAALTMQFFDENTSRTPQKD